MDLQTRTGRLIGVGPAGSDRGGERAATVYSLIITAKLNEVDPRAWLADVLARIADYPVSRLKELLPWHTPPSARCAPWLWAERHGRSLKTLYQMLKRWTSVVGQADSSVIEEPAELAAAE